MKLGRRHNYHKGQPALRIYANHLLNVLNVKELVGAFNQGEALAGASSAGNLRLFEALESIA